MRRGTDKIPVAIPTVQETPSPFSKNQEGSKIKTELDIDPEDTSTVKYVNGAFSPVKLTVNLGDNGCLFKIINLSVDPLVIRLSPHSPEDKRGFPYPPVLPNQSVFIDPRYRIKDIAFHNHQKPKEEFSVKLNKNCQLVD